MSRAKEACMTGYAIARLDEIDEYDDGRVPWRPVRHHFGITSFGINAWTGRAKGDRIINEHDESDPQDMSEELYIVTTGRAVFELDGERREAPAGTYVFVEPAVKRTAFAEEAGPTIVSIGGVPGQAYEPSGWEVWAPVRNLYEEGNYEAVIERGRELIEANPQYSLPLYNLACCESLAGRKEDALAHLRQAVEKSDRVRAYAKEDSDFDAIRDEPAFRELIGA
jgi:tetratricopeptide (TPR) repeat protein